MFLSVLDLILLTLLIFFTAYSFFIGFIEALGSLVGLLLGVWLAGLFYQDVGNWLSSFIVSTNASYVVAFVFTFTIISKLTGLAFYLLNKIYHFLTIIPFLKSINKFAGAAFGALEGALVLGLILLVAHQYPFVPWLETQLQESSLALWLIALAKVLTPLLPKIFMAINPF